MPVTMAQLDSVANAALDFYIKGDPLSQSIQDKPLLGALRAKQSTFPGGRGELKFNVKNDYDTTFMGYEYDDIVTYGNPANIKQVTFTYKELHAGIQVSHTELKRDGITVVDTTTGENTSEVEGRERQAISDLFKDKLEDLKEGGERSFNNICWQDGSSDPKVFGGVLSILSASPTTGVVGGIDRALNSWWRNRTLSAITPSATLQTLIQNLRNESRQLRRYGGRPSKVLCGSDFLEALELEVTGKGDYTNTGFANKSATEVSVAEVTLRGIGKFEYDPTLDDLGLDDYAFVIDERHLMLKVMSGEDMKRHTPARPPEKYVLYRGVTWTGCLIANKLNCHGVYLVI